MEEVECGEREERVELCYNGEGIFFSSQVFYINCQHYKM